MVKWLLILDMIFITRLMPPDRAGSGEFYLSQSVSLIILYTPLKPPVPQFLVQCPMISEGIVRIFLASKRCITLFSCRCLSLEFVLLSLVLIQSSTSTL
ncbi:hypothetical protein KSP40_PGU015492 [Platanthera guangdongensis]|uniref:Secreted protein n=1 Tax=Platanthera guangdongensis TaxID=2320717 RepID=A0ABR2LYC5_9ASPA